MSPHSKYFCLFLLLCLVGCSQFPSPPSTLTSLLYDRNHKAIYRMRVPEDWIRRDPLPDESLSDTTKAICEFIINDPEGKIRITIHNFPSSKMEERIPPAAQVARWQRQFEELAPHQSSTVSQVFNGYVGVLFTGTGIIQKQNKEVTVMGWSLQLAPQHYQTLSHTTLFDTQTLEQMRSDITIKAVGPPSLMEHYQSALINMARSFELIEEIPSRT